MISRKASGHALKKILHYIHNKGMKTTLFTNDYFSDDNWIAFFKSIYLDSIKISVDSIYDCSHSNIRKGNTLRTILNNIDKLINNKIKVEITTIAMKENLSEINDILAYFKEKKSAVTHYIDSYIPNSLEIDTDLNIITPEEYSLIICKRCKDNNLKKLSLKEHYCGFAHNYIFISSEGIVKLCTTMPHEFNIGNINNDTVQFCWDMVVNKFYSLSCKYKNECKYYKYCAGGCRHRAYVFSGEIIGKYIYMCSFYKMMEDYEKND
ncbi:radical SAM protein [uncultured Clostridium sp.]|uniref:radical SAM/SPASM domain-containing protein n=1 Tax=uncultured Clostridium sp. TaxID=59620 RepID=UPI0025D68B69|nr:radical SAM protein [uncultured Clostridium sp.]